MSFKKSSVAPICLMWLASQKGEPKTRAWCRELTWPRVDNQKEQKGNINCVTEVLVAISSWAELPWNLLRSHMKSIPPHQRFPMGHNSLAPEEGCCTVCPGFPYSLPKASRAAALESPGKQCSWDRMLSNLQNACGWNNSWNERWTKMVGNVQYTILKMKWLP